MKSYQINYNLFKIKFRHFQKIALDEIQKGIGNENYQEFINISEPIAAASIAQVHKAQIREDGILKVAIKVLRPNIKKQFNEEIEALVLLAYIIESLIKKQKRLRLVEVVFIERNN